MVGLSLLGADIWLDFFVEFILDVWLFFSDRPQTAKGSSGLIFLMKILWRKFWKHSARWVYLPNPSSTGRVWHKVSFQTEWSWFEFIVFLLLDWLPNQGQRSQFPLLFTHRWWENSWIHSFTKGMNSVKSKQPYTGVKRGSPISFSVVTSMLSVHPM